MSISIQTNVASLEAQNFIRINNNFQSNTIEQLSSGYRINSSADDAAGLAVANKYSGNIAELNQGVLNANNGVSALQMAASTTYPPFSTGCVRWPRNRHRQRSPATAIH